MNGWRQRIRATATRSSAVTRVAAAVLALAGLAVGAGCASSPAVPASGDVYLGAGRGATLGEAMNAAKMDAVRKAVIDLIGAEAEAANAARLDDVLYSTRTPNAFVHNDTMETLRRDGSIAGGDVYYELRIRVNVPAVRSTLDANGIRRAADRPAPASQAVGPAAAPPPTATGPAAIPAVDYGPVTDAERRFIARFVDTMTYMVYFSERGEQEGADPFIMRSAVNQAASYLVSDGRIVVDAAQVERLKDDQRLIYEEETGREIGLLQWIARRLNSDVYIELDVRASSSASGTGFNATADVTLSMYETSTGQVLGSLNRRSPTTFSRVSRDDAVLNAIQSTVYQAMPQAVEMARRQMSLMLTRGIRYEVTVQNPPDARALTAFRRALLDRAREVATISQVAREVRYEVYYIGSSDDMVELLFSVADRVAGFEDFQLVISRGRSLTVDAGY